LFAFINIVVSIVPIPAIYYIYRMYFSRKYRIEYIQGFFFGVIIACLVVIFHYYIISKISVGSGVYITAFFKAAFIEKIFTFIILYFLLVKFYKNLNTKESIAFAMFLGLGFAFIENIIYSVDNNLSVMLTRIISSVPMHFTTCGIMGYFISKKRLYNYRPYKISALFIGFTIPYIIHSAYDYFLFSGGSKTYGIAPSLVIAIFLLEFLIAKALSRPDKDSLKSEKIFLEDWIAIKKIPQYEKWIKRSMGIKNIELVPFFLFSYPVQRLILLGILVFLPFLYIIYELLDADFIKITLSPEEQVSLFIMYPFMYVFDLLLQGSINPKYFENNILRIPIISNVKIIGDKIYSTTSADISLCNTFFKTLQPLNIGTDVSFHFEFSGISSPVLHGRVIWENHNDPGKPFGSVVKWKVLKMSFVKFYLQFNIFKITRGIIFNIKLPGFEAIRQLFVKTATVMEETEFYRKDEIIFKEGEIGKRFFLLKQGVVEIFETMSSGEIIVFDTVEQGEIFGEMALVGNQPRAASAKCLTDCILASASGDNLEALITSNQEFALLLITTLAKRIHNSEKILKNKIKVLESHKGMVSE